MKKDRIEFYTLEISTNEKIAGCRAANEKKYDWQSLKSQSKLSSTQLPDFEPIFSGIILTKKSVESDFLLNSGAIMGRGFIVSKKVKELFKEFHLPLHRYYPLTLLSNPEEKVLHTDKYFWLQIQLEDFSNWIDLPKSSLFLVDNETEAITELNLTSIQDFKKVVATYNQEKDEELGFNHIVVTKEHAAKAYDLFYLEDFVFPAIISTALKERLERENITGLSPFEPLNISKGL